MTLSSVVVKKPFSSTPSIAMVAKPLFPFQRPLLPFVDEADDEDCKEDEHCDETKIADVFQHDGPGEEECDLEVEQDEEDRDEVVAHVEFHPRVLERLEAAFVRRKLLGVGARRRDEATQPQHERAEPEPEEDEQQNGEVLFQHFSIQHSAFSIQSSARIARPDAILPTADSRQLTAENGADGETRTPTAFATAPSRQRVYHFHHVGFDR